MPKMYPELFSSEAVKRYNGGKPILTKDDMPYEADCIFNAGVVKYHGKYVMTFRNDYRFDGVSSFERCFIGLAFSDDGIHWDVQKEPFLSAEGMNDKEITRIYDPRLTVIDDRIHICFAVDTKHGIRGGIGVISDNFKSVDILSMTVPDNRNMVLFPEKIDGKYLRLERPFPVYSRGGADRFDIWMSSSPDLKYWGESKLLLAVEDVPFANDKIGPGAPPVKTEAGWLTVFHTVDKDPSRGKNGWEPKWQKRYCAGLMLLDLKDPTKIIGMSKEPLLAPETPWEADEGFRTNVIFPGGLIAEEDGTVKIYYGASDTAVCMATAKLSDLITLCKG